MAQERHRGTEPMFAYDETATVDPASRDEAGAAAARRKSPWKRDTHGNALGGIRLAEIAVPVAKESAKPGGLGGTHRCPTRRP